MSKITKIHAQEILDSRGNPTIETTIDLDNGSFVSSSVPSGASTSSFEAVELKDKDMSRYEGKGVLKACEVVNNVLAKLIVGKNPLDQKIIDKSMIGLDGTENKSKLGGNSILSVSQAVVKAGALSQNLKLWDYIQKLISSSPPRIPSPSFNIINGGLHGGGNLDIQEFHVVPRTDIPYSKALEIGQETYEKLKEILTEKNLVHSIGDEGGYAPNLKTNEEGLDLILEAIKLSGNIPFKDVFMGIDASSSNIKQAVSNPKEWFEYLIEIQKKYQLLFIEDGVTEDDWNSWKKLTSAIGDNCMIVGDDFLATNFNRLKRAINEKAANALIIKPNQVGTITETLEVIKLAKENAWKTIVSHRSGETNDTFIADLAVGVGADYVKFGAPSRGERVAKYNRLLEIERELELAC